MKQKGTGVFSIARVVVASALFVTILLLWLIGPPAVKAAAGINEQLNFQGRLLDSTGAVVADGNYNMQFKIYQDGNGILGGGDETLKWTETRRNNNSQGVVVKNGYFSVNLGSITAFGASVDWNQDTLWLSIHIGGTNPTCTPFSTCAGAETEMDPFKRLSSTPYALNSKYLGGLQASSFAQLATNQTFTGTNTFQPTTNISSVVIKQTSNGTPTADIFNLQTANATNILQATGPAANESAVTLQSVGATRVLTLNSASTSADAIDINATAGGIDIDAANSTLAITNTANSDADDLTIAQVGAFDASLILSSAGTGTDAIKLDATGACGDIDINALDTITVDAATMTFTLAAGTTDFTIGGLDADSTLNLTGLAGNNAILYADTTGIVKTAATSTGSQCLLSGAAAAYTPAWGSCSGGSTTLQNAYDAGPTILTDASGDIIFHVIGGATDTQFEVNAASAPELDMVLITNAGQGITSTTGVDGLAINYVQATNATAITGSALDISVTQSGDATDTIRGLNINNITGGSSTETALQIGTGWDRDILFSTDSAHTLKVEDQDNAATAGSALSITGAAGNTTGTGGAISLTAGAGGSGAATGGGLTFTSGAGGGTSGNSGALTLVTGNTPSGTAGDVVIDVGTSTSGNGTISIGTAARTQTITIGNSTGGTITIVASSGSDLALNDAQWSISGAGLITTASNLAVNGGTISSTASTLVINAGGTVDIQDAVTADSLTVDGGDITFSGTTARNIVGPSTGGLTVGVTSGPLTLSTTTSGTLAVTSAAALNLTAGGTSAMTYSSGVTSGSGTSGASVFTDASLGTTGDFIYLNPTSTTMTTGSLIKSAGVTYNHTAGETGNLADLAFTEGTTNAFTTTTNGLLITPTINAASGAATRTTNGISVAPAFTACGAGTCAVNGLNVGNVTDAANFTGTAVNIGTGWDTGISVGSGAIVTSNLGVDYTDSDTNPGCAAGEYKIYADTSETKLKKCQNGTAADLDTGGGGSLQAAYDGGATITAASATNLAITLPDVATDPNFLVSVTSPSTSKFAVQSGANDVFTVQPSADIVKIQDNAGNLAFNFNTSTSTLRIYENIASPVNYLELYYDNATSKGIVKVTSGTLELGSGSGPISLEAGAGAAVTILGHAASSFKIG